MNRRASDPASADYSGDRSTPFSSGSGRWIVASLLLLLLGGFGGLTIANWAQTSTNAKDVAVLGERIQSINRRLDEHYQGIQKTLDEIKSDLKEHASR